MHEKSILDGFSELSNKNETVEILKELFDAKKINMISEMSKDEIKLATRISIVAELKGIDYWKSGLERFLEFKLSNSRKSRKEIIDALGQQNKPKEGFFDKMNMFRK